MRSCHGGIIHVIFSVFVPHLPRQLGIDARVVCIHELVILQGEVGIGSLAKLLCFGVVVFPPVG